MRSHRWFANGTAALLAAFALWASSAAQAQYFRDDFEDGSATDGSPVTWITEVPPYPEGDLRVEDGSLVLTPRPSEFFADFWETNFEVERTLPADLIVRTQVRALGAGFSYQGIYARDTHNVDARQGQAVGVLVGSDGLIALLRVTDGSSTWLQEASLAPANTINNDVNLELRLEGDSALVYAWADGSPRPTTPTLRSVGGVGSSWNTPGRVGLVAGQEDDTAFVSSAFRFVEVTPLPEPGSLVLVASAVACCCWRPGRRNARRWTGAACSPLLLVTVVVASQSSHAATIFYDDFEDGSATDGTPVTWDKWQDAPETTIGVDGGSLRVGTANPEQAGIFVVAALTLGNTSIRAQVRLEGDGDQSVGVLVRGQGGYLGAHALEVAADGTLWFGLAGSYTSRPSDLRPRAEDVVLQLDAVGNQVTFSAWRANETKPLVPAFQRTTGNVLASGLVGGYYTEATMSPPTSGTAIYRYVHVADSPIPEPSTLGLLGLAAACGMRRNSRRRLPLVR